MSLKDDIDSIMQHAAEIKRCREMLDRELAEIERWHRVQVEQLAKEIAQVEIRIALSELEAQK